MIRSTICLLATLILTSSILFAEDGYRLWLRYDEIEDTVVKDYYQNKIGAVHFAGDRSVLLTAKTELRKGLTGLLGKEVSLNSNIVFQNSLIAGIIGESQIIGELLPTKYIDQITAEGFLILDIGTQILLVAKDDKGLLYGSFDLLRRIQTHQSLDGIEVVQNPKVQLRVLNHWDNLDRTVERGYAGFSIWNWHELPRFIDRRYTEYARANASIGINGAVVTNVNANALIFRKDYMEKAAALADVLRPYGIKLYLTARFSAPIEQGGLSTADPLDPNVQKWWDKKVEEIYTVIPDFGGFLVKANSEGQPGPQQYGRNHADGANMLASALEPHGGVVMWRAFVYSNEEPVDRAKQAYNEFMPLDGKFKKNVLVQVKNGPIDFQPREPIHPLFGAMEETSVMMEFQITKEYLGQGTHMVGLANMYEEILKTDTYAKGKGSLVAKVVDGSLHGNQLTGIAGVANIGTARNWTGNLFGQADWYAYGRLAWDPYLSAEQIFDEWVKMTLTHNENGIKTIKSMLKSSYETCVSNRTPLGLHHIMAAGHHYGPGPWVDQMSRADWTSVYYHKADENGIGFDRTKTGSDALAQYSEELRDQYNDMDSCPLEFLLWFHHVPWEHELKTGRSLWEELCHKYHTGAQEVSQLRQDWLSVKEYIDDERFEHVDMHLSIQEEESIWWRDACLSYFQTFSKLEIPQDLEQPKYDVEHYKSIIYPYSPGIRPRW